tara:strand:+ start:148 stop:684 length:537 start_codon:yes stop_codon:yes gene_type:complete
MLTRKKYAEELDESMQMYIDLMKKCWGEAPELNPKVEVVLKVSMDFDLGDFPHQGQVFYVSPEKEVKLSPDKVAKRIVQEINSHRNHCNRCGVPVPHIWSRQHGQSTRLIGRKNWRTGELYTEEDLMLYDLPPDELERKLHPMISGRVDKRLKAKAEAEKNSPEAYDKEMDAWFGTLC